MKTADPELMRAINRFHVMDAIRRFGPVSPGRNLAIHRIERDDRLGDHRGAARRPADHPDAGRARCATPAAAARASCCRLNPDAAFVVGVKLAPDQITVAVTNFCADVLRTLALPIRIDRQTAVGDRRSGRGRRAPLRQRRRARDGGDRRRLRRPARRRRARGRRLPAEPDFHERDVTFGAESDARGSASRSRSTATSISSRSPSIGSDRRATSTIFWSSASSAASVSAFCTTANCFAAPTASAPTSATSWSARRRSGGGRLADLGLGRPRCSAEVEALPARRRARDRLSRRTRHGASAAARRRRRRTLRRACSPARRGARFRDRQSDHACSRRPR